MTVVPQFAPPGQGFWERDAVHFPRPVTRYWTDTHPEPFARGVHEFASSYGMLLDGLVMRYVNGVGYKQVVPVADDEVPVRFGRAEATFAEKLWRKQLGDWDGTVKPASIQAHLELQSVEADLLSETELAEYLGRCRDHHAQMIYQHMRFTAAALVPTGDFLAHVGDWTGIGLAELLGLMRGSAPVSAGASDQLSALIDAVGRDPRAQALLDSNEDPAGILTELRSLDGPTGLAVEAYLDLVGYRLLDGFDISNPCALELPDALLRAIRAAAAAPGEDGSEVDAQTAAVRDRVPDEHRAEFDELLAEARLTYRVRDERGVFSDIWASGLMRRAVLAAGRRLAEAGQLHEPVHLIDAGLDEMQSLVTGSGGPVRRRACRPGRAARVAEHGRGAIDVRGPAAASTGPVRAAACRGTPDARDRHRARRGLRQLRGGARRRSPPRTRGQPGRRRGNRPLHLRARRVRPDRRG